MWLSTRLLKTFRQPAPNQTTILDVFQEDEWAKSHIDDPLSRSVGEDEADARRRLHETIKNLNRGLPPGTIRFHGDGTGEGVRWEYDRGQPSPCTMSLREGAGQENEEQEAEDQPGCNGGRLPQSYPLQTDLAKRKMTCAIAQVRSKRKLEGAMNEEMAVVARRGSFRACRSVRRTNRGRRYTTATARTSSCTGFTGTPPGASWMPAVARRAIALLSHYSD